MGFIQRLLARRGYIRLADYGLVLTPYGVVRAQDHWQAQAGYLPGPPQVAQGQVSSAALAQHNSSASVAGLQANSAPLGNPPVRSDSNADGNTTVAQPLSEFRPPLAASTEPGGGPRSRWPEPAALATVMVDAERPQPRTQTDEDEKTLFSEPPLFQARSATPF